MEYLTVGQMAKLNCISEQTLRLYDKIGLLSPCHRDDYNNYRYYDVKQCAVLDIIQYMKAMGMQLKDIKYQLDHKNIDLIEKFLWQRHAQIQDEIQTLKFQRRGIERTIDSLERYRTSPPDGTILLEYIEKRHMYYIDSGINVYDYDLETYEKILRDLRYSLMADELPQIYFFNAGMILRQKELMKSNFYSTEAFVFVDSEVTLEKHILTVPANYYLCIFCNDFYKEKEYIGRLMDEINRKGYQICGDYLCESIADIPVINHTERGMHLRLQIPIKFF
ncbi:MerR family transcriptional regulator [Clostridium aminobutyricum]|uniref:MerR family transcriptional regulator n=1 Tax=Clostridium aminobutyricum TaxID=33953 RepID=A0A939D6J7_CLOAM|nr:MerR family transcriptional regulator [Clostridium aminobutyricum]MBN7771758.1 MerR family transcriptional regulator [Clostridium aminobutyricum]